MEFDFDINRLFPEEITIVGPDLAPFDSSSRCRGISAYAQQVALVVDAMGEASARAQALRQPITSAVKLRPSQQRVYLLKDERANTTRGAVVGFLKVGNKRLFVLDARGTQHQVAPLCVLDFYVAESRQRAGAGRRLFERMLEAEGATASALAVDRPSHKFVSFLARHYGLRDQIPQVNNFVVFDGFFSGHPPDGAAAPLPCGRPAGERGGYGGATCPPTTRFERERKKANGGVPAHQQVAPWYGSERAAGVATRAGAGVFSRYSASPTLLPATPRTPSRGPPVVTATLQETGGRLLTVDLTGRKVAAQGKEGEEEEEEGGGMQDACGVRTGMPEVAGGVRRYEDLAKDTSWKIFGMPAGIGGAPAGIGGAPAPHARSTNGGLW
ncbi:PREDICTED: alpha-tubulin N-acetyltransferase 1-like [Priapulus caudatus]|uniref:Alpha-tubulin N-acetyltransferase n=1 Tax=Priapulus caudatus TaxID=37621 RepID=A0ABM1F132_PRICU|nr:PREDICTED: alpha-tubulin N-acetyltransferase 1-like [Priapulus caudatus]